MRDGDWDSVRNEQVDSSVCGTDEELRNLKGSQGSLDDVRDAVAECRYGVVGVLELVRGVLERQLLTFLPS